MSKGTHISEVANLLGVHIYELRQWQKEFNGLPSETFFSDDQINTARTIKRLLRGERLSLAGVKRHLAKTEAK